MLVELLRATIYRESGWDWWTEDIANPSWSDVAFAIRRLDRFQYPFVWLFRKTDVAEDAPPDFNVIGGQGAFAFDCRVDGAEYRYHDAAGGDNEIEVWRSDQGWTCAEKYVCFDIDKALQAARYFCEHGQPDPALPWQRYE